MTLKKKPYLLLALVLTIVFFALYTFFDFRQGGTHLTIFSAHLMPLQFFLDRFGFVYVSSRIVLDLLIAALSAVLLVVTLDNYHSGSAMFSRSACSTGATLILGLATFGCPSCVLPIAGTFGIIFSSQALPLFGFEFKILSLVLVLGTLIWFLLRFKHLSQGAAILQEEKSGSVADVHVLPH
jgi:hypothetical protein